MGLIESGGMVAPCFLCVKHPAREIVVFSRATTQDKR